MSPRPRSVSDAEVLEATGRAISRLGPTNLTLADVADEAGLAPPTLIQRFGSKRGLLLAFAERSVAGVGVVFDSARARHDAPLAALRAALVGLTEPLDTRETLANHVGFLQMDLAEPDFHRHALEHGRALRREIASLLAEAIERGELPVCDVAERAKAVQMMFSGSMITWAIHGEGTLEEAVGEGLATVVGCPD